MSLEIINETSKKDQLKQFLFGIIMCTKYTFLVEGTSFVSFLYYLLESAISQNGDYKELKAFCV